METLPIWFFSFNSIRWEKKNKRATIYEEPSAPSSFISDSCLFVLCLLTHTHKQQKKNKWIAPMEIFRLDFCLFCFVFYSFGGRASLVSLSQHSKRNEKKKGNEWNQKEKNKRESFGFRLRYLRPFPVGWRRTNQNASAALFGRSFGFLFFFFLFILFFFCLFFLVSFLFDRDRWIDCYFSFALLKPLELECRTSLLGFYRVFVLSLQSFSWFRLSKLTVAKGGIRFTEFYWVLLSFTGFY